MVPIFFNCIELRFKLSTNWATLLKLEQVLVDNQIKIAFYSMNLVSQYKSSNLAHILEQISRLLTWDMESIMQVDLIISWRKFVIVNYCKSLASYFFKDFASSCVFGNRIKAIGFLTLPNI